MNLSSEFDNAKTIVFAHSNEGWVFNNNEVGILDRWDFTSIVVLSLLDFMLLRPL